MRRMQVISGLFFAVALTFALSGCTKPAGGEKDANKDKHGKAHPPAGPHEGPYAEWEVNDKEYHVEFTVDPTTKEVTVYVLDEHVKASPTSLDPKQISKVKVSLDTPKKQDVELNYDAKKSEEKKGFAFVGKHDIFGEKGAEFKGRIQGEIKINDKVTPQNNTFPNPNYKKPAEKKTSQLRELYLKPGGIYTADDVKANGSTTPQEKYADKIWKHPKKKPGDKICPVTDNRAEAECFWIVNGQRYEFCCTPCLDSFIEQAHHEPGNIKPAKEYVYAGK